MKRWNWVSYLLALIILFGQAAVYAQPPYAKWGRIAVQETQRKYPKAQMIDYYHVGRVQVSPSSSKETFRLWLRQDRREWAVIVSITFITASEKIISIEIKE